MKRPLIAGSTAFLVLLASAAGYLVGHSRGESRGVDRLRLETQGNLGVHIEALARLRTEDVKGATQLLDRSVDAAVATLPMGKPFGEQPEGTRQVLMAARVYRTRFPTADENASRALADVPPLPSDHPYCSRALAEIAKMKPAGDRG
ncbi:MAG TPA: hypothetical protein VFB66_02810 [Tepidisphaeraceae bacterium]|nr:hypothetical protein [Tepidisphaeraceae bacterium]